jgi:hypothetical protein
VTLTNNHLRLSVRGFVNTYFEIEPNVGQFYVTQCDRKTGKVHNRWGPFTEENAKKFKEEGEAFLSRNEAEAKSKISPAKIIGRIVIWVFIIGCIYSVCHPKTAQQLADEQSTREGNRLYYEFKKEWESKTPAQRQQQEAAIDRWNAMTDEQQQQFAQRWMNMTPEERDRLINELNQSLK